MSSLPRRKRRSPEQIISALREAEGMLSVGQTIGQVCKKSGVCEQTHHRWRNEYGGMKGDAVKRLKQLEEENRRLQKAVTDLTLDKQILKEAMSIWETDKRRRFPGKGVSCLTLALDLQ